jgi:hypothetical protein
MWQRQLPRLHQHRRRLHDIDQWNLDDLGLDAAENDTEDSDNHGSKAVENAV